MAILKHIIPLSGLLMLTGCYEDFNPKIDNEPVLCINSLITAGEPIEVSVSHTWLYTDESASIDHDVDDAVVKVYSNDILVDADYIPQEGDRIKIVAESESYGRAEGEVTVPLSVPIESVDWKADVTDVWCSDEDIWTDSGATGDDLSEGGYDYWLKRMSVDLNLYSKVTIKDPAGSVEYYEFSFSSFPEEEEYDPDVSVIPSLSFYAGNFKEENEPIFSEHLSSFDIMTGSGSYGFTFFSDRQFQGSSYSLTVSFEGARCSLSGENLFDIPLDCGYLMELSTVSPSYYYWCNYRWNKENGSINDLEDMGMTDPTWGYSNVSTGAGVIAAKSVSTYPINLRDFLEKYFASLK